ncbi:MAG TPA: hypothetical protein VGN34_07605 [Ktedonobacteraceae bacterium]
MGQYKLWQHYRETDQRLHTQLTQLNAQLNTLKEQAQLLDESISLSENIILQTLLAQLVPATPSASPASGAAQQTLSTPPLTPTLPIFTERMLPSAPEQYKIPASPSSYDKADRLHHASPPFFPLPSTLLPETPSTMKPPSTPHPELDLLPEDITSFVDEHTQTVPLRTPPWWLRKIPANSVAAGAFQELKDQQSERTNHLVQRWLERWGRSADAPRREDQQ